MSTKKVRPCATKPNKCTGKILCFTFPWRKLLTPKQHVLSILKEINPEYSLEGLMLKLKLQYVGHLMWITSSLEKTMRLGKACMFSRVWHFVTPLTGAHQAPLSMGFSQQEYWNGFLFLPLGGSSQPKDSTHTSYVSCTTGLFFTTEPPGKPVMLGKIEDKRRRGWQRIRLSDCITNLMDMNLSKLWEIVEDRGAWQATGHGVTKSRTRHCDWKVTATWLCILKYIENLQIT